MSHKECVLSPWSFHGLFCVHLFQGSFANCFSHTVCGEQEELCCTAGSYLLPLWLWFNHHRASLYSSTLHCKGKKCHPLSSLNGATSQRCLKWEVYWQALPLHPLSFHVISKWPPLNASSWNCSQRISTQGKDLQRCNVGSSPGNLCLPTVPPRIKAQWALLLLGYRAENSLLTQD